jgi:hypothetical protein
LKLFGTPTITVPWRYSITYGIANADIVSIGEIGASQRQPETFEATFRYVSA